MGDLKSSFNSKHTFLSYWNNSIVTALTLGGLWRPGCSWNKGTMVSKAGVLSSKIHIVENKGMVSDDKPSWKITTPLRFFHIWICLVLCCI